jgi:hypothetical protein
MRRAVQPVAPPRERGDAPEDLVRDAEQRVGVIERPRQERQARPVEHRAIDVVAAQGHRHGQPGPARDPGRHVSRVHGAHAVHERVAVVREQRAGGERQELERLVRITGASHAMDREVAALFELDAARRRARRQREHVESLEVDGERGSLPRRRGGDIAPRGRKSLGEQENPHGPAIIRRGS